MPVSHAITTTASGGTVSSSCSCGTLIAIPGDDMESANVAQVVAAMNAHAANPPS